MYDLYPGQRATGEVIFDGSDILAPDTDLYLLRARIGMVFQKPTPFPMSIYENIAFGMRLFWNFPKSELDDRVEGCLRRAALWEEAKDYLSANGLSLSGGVVVSMLTATLAHNNSDPKGWLEKTHLQCVDIAERMRFAGSTADVDTDDLRRQIVVQVDSVFTGMMISGQNSTTEP